MHIFKVSIKNSRTRNRVVGMASELSRWSDTRAHASAMDTRYNLLLLSADSSYVNTFGGLVRRLHALTLYPMQDTPLAERVILSMLGHRRAAASINTRIKPKAVLELTAQVRRASINISRNDVGRPIAHTQRNGSFGGSFTDVTLKHGQKLFFVNSLYSCTIFATMMSFKYLTRTTLRLNKTFAFFPRPRFPVREQWQAFTRARAYYICNVSACAAVSVISISAFCAYQQQRPREYAHHEEEHEKGEAACICAGTSTYILRAARAESCSEREGPFSVRSCNASAVSRAPGGCLMASCAAPNESSSS
ncbi:unnamed protein product [Trichogramma brassicae]|uniref:Uncharacterized protein n=1 Tax=Trichogramma brassicae TaxID=86971 RepID=A0A6H5I9J6_9HYME|nr:unnamed protein product [Trichogramma brassicae]